MTAKVEADKQALGRQFYLDGVLPRLNLDLKARYPFTRLEDAPGYRSLAERKLLMLVALTGSGKTTTLATLRRRMDGLGMDVIPTRREVADWIAIPTVQIHKGEALRPVPDRVERFQYTRTFAELLPGGMATAFSWLNILDDYGSVIISEGIRGPREIAHALRNYPGWTIVELNLHPLTRLRRLSARRERFDQPPGGLPNKTAGGADLSFLPREMREEAGALLAAGEITERALAIISAEAANYGLRPFEDGVGYPNYHRVNVDGCSPDQVADRIEAIIRETQNDGY